jgi:CubicO group peptidase (beta-lactamase class C family)
VAPRASLAEKRAAIKWTVPQDLRSSPKRDAMNKYIVVLIACVLLPLRPVGATGNPAALPHAAPESVGFSSERLKRIDRWMGEEVDAGHKSGAVVLIARHGRVVYEKAYGYADAARRTPLRTDAIFRLFSMSKPITSVALLTLYEQGRFQLTDPLSRIVPAFKDMKVYAGTDSAGNMTLVPAQHAITLQDVFRHTAGFAYGAYFDSNPVDKAYATAGATYTGSASLEELVQKVAREPLLYEPGSRYVYSFAHDVQAYLVQQLSGESFDAYCRHAVFEPLGMRDTVFGEPADRAARIPTAYHAGADGTLTAFTPEEDVYRLFGTRPFGGLSMSAPAEDYLRFAQMLLNGGQLNGVRVLSRKTVELMTSDNLPPGTQRPDWMAGQGYGLGVGVMEDPALAGNLGSKGSYGWPGAASTWFVIDPHEDLIGMIFTQYYPRDVRFNSEFETLLYQSLAEQPPRDASTQQRHP